MRISPTISWSQPGPVFDHYWLYLSPDNVPPPVSGITLLHRLKHLKHPLGFCTMVINTGLTREVLLQLSFAPDDRTIVDTGVKKAFHNSHLRPGSDILLSAFKTIRNEPDHFVDFEFDFRDILRLNKYTPDQAAACFLSVGSALIQGEIFFQDCVLYPEPTEKGTFRYRSLLRYGVVCRRNRRDDLLSAVTHSYGPELPCHSWHDYKRRGITGKQIFAMLLNRNAHRYGSIMSVKQLGMFFFGVWGAPVLLKAGLNLPILQGNPPHPSLLTHGIWIGYSLYDGSNRPVFLNDDYTELSIVISGSTGSGKSTILERLSLALMSRQTPRNTVILIEKKGELSPRILGMMPDDRKSDVMYYAPAKYHFRCNILDVGDDAVTISQFIDAFGRAVAVQDLTLTPNVKLMLRNAMRALRPWGKRATIMHVHDFFANEIFRKDVVRHCNNTYVKQFVDDLLPIIAPTSKSAFFNKLDVFKDIPILSSTCQPSNSLDFNECMKTSKLVFADLSGMSPETVSDLGTFLFARAAIEGYLNGPSALGDNWLTIILDEFHDFIEEGMLNNVLTQGRSRHMSVILAHQTIKGQLSREQESTILGNCPVKLCFRVEHEDAFIMGKLLGVPAAELASLENYHAYLKVGTLPAVKIRTAEPLPSSDALRDAIIQESKTRYEAPIIDPFDPFELFKDTSDTESPPKKKKHRYDTL